MRPALIIGMVVAAALGLAACGFGEEKVSVAQDDPNYNGAVLFATHCSGCHTLSAAGTQGSGNRGERTQGPNLNQRTETFDD
ncbi:MAG TPA: c-type cytochrome, partial [Solirubrobacterales bacterium]|nr:c-type cytochrome [Solirubrobacterales bacterium]